MASHRRPAQHRLTRSARASMLTAAATAATAVAAAAAVPAGAAAPGSGAPGVSSPSSPSSPANPSSASGDPSGIASQVNALYAQAESATQLYDGAREREARLRQQLDELRDRVARDQQRVNGLADGLAQVALAQYRDGGIDPLVALLLSSNPGDYLDRAADLARSGTEQAAELRQLRSAQRALEQERAEATDRLGDLERTQTALATHRRTVQEKLRAAQRLLDALPPAQRAALDLALDPGADAPGAPGMPGMPGAPQPLPSPGLPSSSDRAAVAVAAAESAVGLPYAWGSAGPGSFDCSGLMVWAYRHAGVSLPRTSQEQLDAGQRVPLSQIRPGDLVIYRGNASHVAMYVGHGEVVHAPYPGAHVRYDPVTMMPIAGVTRI